MHRSIDPVKGRKSCGRLMPASVSCVMLTLLALVTLRPNALEARNPIRQVTPPSTRRRAVTHVTGTACTPGHALLPSASAACALINSREPAAFTPIVAQELSKFLTVTNASCRASITGEVDLAKLVRDAAAITPLCTASPSCGFAKTTRCDARLTPIESSKVADDIVREGSACNIELHAFLSAPATSGSPETSWVRLAKPTQVGSWLRFHDSLPRCQRFATAALAGDVSVRDAFVATLAHTVAARSSVTRNVANESVTRLPLHIFVGDSMIRQLFFRLVAAIRGVDAWDPHYDAAIRHDVCFTVFDDGSDLLEMYAAPRTDTDSLASLTAQGKAAMNEIKSRLEKRSGAAELASRARRQWAKTDVWQGLASARMAESVLKRKVYPIGVRANADITACGLVPSNTSTTKRVLFALAFLWNPETWSFRSEYAALQPVASHTASFMYWESQLSAAYWSLVAMVHGNTLRGEGCSTAASQAKARVAVKLWAAEALKDRTLALHADTQSAVQRLYEASVHSAESRLNQLVDDAAFCPHGSASDVRYVHLDIPFTYERRTGIPMLTNATENATTAPPADGMCLERQLTIRGANTATARVNTRMGATLADERVNIGAKNTVVAAAVRALNDVLRKDGTGSGSVLPFNRLASALQNGARRADPHHFSCRLKLLRPSLAQYRLRSNLTSALLAANASDPRVGNAAPGTTARLLLDTADKKGYFGTALAHAAEPLPPATCDAGDETCEAPPVPASVAPCADPVNLAVAALWLSQIV
jgi:hypothetical protein